MNKNWLSDNERLELLDNLKRNIGFISWIN